MHSQSSGRGDKLLLDQGGLGQSAKQARAGVQCPSEEISLWDICRVFGVGHTILRRCMRVSPKRGSGHHWGTKTPQSAPSGDKALTRLALAFQGEGTYSAGTEASLAGKGRPRSQGDREAQYKQVK